MTKYFLRVYSHYPTMEDDALVDVTVLGIHPDLAQRLGELGIIDYQRGFIPAWQAARLRRVMRLRRNLGVNLPGAAIIVDLLDRINDLQDEIERLKRLGYK